MSRRHDGRTGDGGVGDARPGRLYPFPLGLPKFLEAKDFGQITADDDWRIVSRLGPLLEGRVADTEWKPLPAGLWTLPAVFMEAGNLLLEAFMEAGVPTWKVREKTSDPLKWNMIAEGTADSFEAAKAAALYEAETALRNP